MATNQVVHFVLQSRQNLPKSDSTIPQVYWASLRKHLNYLFEGGGLGNIGSPTYAEQLLVSDNNTYATGVLTIASVAAGNTITVNGVQFVAVSGTAVVANNEFKRGVSDTADAASFCTTFNACTDSRITGLLTASSSLGVITFTPKFSGCNSMGATLETTGVVASGTVTYVAPSGTETITINGVAVTGTAGATATATATVMAAAVNASANTLVANHVRATSNAGVVTIYAKYPGKLGNCITLAASGTGATAGAARLAGGTLAQWEGAQASGTVTISSGSGSITATINGVDSTITWASSDSNSATLLSNAINQNTDPLVQGMVYASASSGVVTITCVRGGLKGNSITLAATGTGATASGARLTGGAAPTQVALTTGTTSYSFPGARLSGAVQDAPVTFTF